MREFTTVDESGELQKFPISPAVPADKMLSNMRINIARDLPEATICKPHDMVMSIAGGGPSLADTYKDLDGYICAVNGSLKWLLDHDPVEGARYACGIMDAGEHIADMIVVHPDVRYYVASHCDPSVFEKLKNCDVRIWHVTPNSMEDPVGAEEILDAHYPFQWITVGGGCTMGLRWIDLGYFLGFRKFRLHGMDSSFRQSTHAYPDRADDKQWIEYKGRKTRLNFLCQVYDFAELLERLWKQDPSIEIEVFGDGLLQDEWKEFRDANPDAFRPHQQSSHGVALRTGRQTGFAFRPLGSQTVTVACINAGNYQGRGKEYVEKLHRMVRRNLGSFSFVCFTDDPEPYAEGIEKRLLPDSSLKGWWHKLSLFKPGVFNDGERVVFFDLDTVITGSIEDFAAYDGEFAMLGQFFAYVAQPYAGNQSAVMSWRVGAGSEIWEAFERQGFPDVPGGDQAFINSLGIEPDIWQQMLPGRLVSFKASGGEQVSGASVVCFHGLPRPHQCGGWVKDYWI